MAALTDKGRLTPAVLRVPIYAVLDEGLGQRGAHYIAHKLLRKQRPAGGAGAGAAAGSASERCPVTGKACGDASKDGCPVPGWLLPFLAGFATAALAHRTLLGRRHWL